MQRQRQRPEEEEEAAGGSAQRRRSRSLWSSWPRLWALGLGSCRAAWLALPPPPPLLVLVLALALALALALVLALARVQLAEAAPASGLQVLQGSSSLRLSPWRELWGAAELQPPPPPLSL